MKDDTTIVHAGRKPFDNHGIVNPPVYHASTVLFPTVEAWEQARERRDQPGTIVYGRRGTPTTFALQDAMAELEGADHCLAVPSGLAAITAPLLAFLDPGDHMLMVDAVYYPARRFADTLLARMGVETTFYDPAIGAGIAGLIRQNTRVVYLEAPGSQTFEMQDIPAIAEVARKAGAVTMMDNTWATPLYFKPLDFGVDISIMAATKYIVGHSDAMLGLVSARDEHFARVRESAWTLGMAVGPDDCYLGQRGLRTLSARLARHQESAMKLAEWFEARPEVDRVLYPALPSNPGHEIWKRDFEGASGLFGVVLRDASRDAVAAMLNGYRYFGMGGSWGGYESLVLPTQPERLRSATTWDAPGPTLRYHAGLEDADDLIADLEAGFERLGAAREAGE
ncbi:MAG: cystathionine beta-lyase [Alphaproteobacteria bacterium]|nr:cystathionine beta-lyase [Alphaproteobacteria bacterium]